MNKPFVPHTPEKEVTARITLKEADLLRRLRDYSYGKFVISKADNILVRLEIQESVLLTEEDGLGLDDKSGTIQRGGLNHE